MGLDNPATHESDSLLLGRDCRRFFLRAAGGIRAPPCWPLRESFLPALDTLTTGASVFVDLSTCSYMDSTFIGLLVAADKRIRKACGGRVRLVLPSAQCADLLAGMGLAGFFPTEAGGIDHPPVMLEVESDGERPDAGFVLDAHQALMETSDEARKKFSLLSEVLRRSAERGKDPRGTPEG